MDRHLKERLVGAAVLVVCAVIFIPEMLTGPKDTVPAQGELLPSDAPTVAGGVKTYTIDLNAVQDNGVAEASETNEGAATVAPSLEVSPAPPPEEQVVARTQREAKSTPPTATAAPTAESTRSKASVAASVRESRTTEPVKGDGDWAVQVASFGARATADRIAGELKAKGFKSYVMPVESKGQTLYRVRVGPVADRAAADALLTRVKVLHPGAAVVTQ